MACNSPASPAVWDGNSDAITNRATRGPVLQPSLSSSLPYMEDHTHHNWYQQGLHLPQAGHVHHSPRPPHQHIGAVYWKKKGLSFLSLDPSTLMLHWLHKKNRTVKWKEFVGKSTSWTVWSYVLCPILFPNRTKMQDLNINQLSWFVYQLLVLPNNVENVATLQDHQINHKGILLSDLKWQEWLWSFKHWKLT